MVDRSDVNAVDDAAWEQAVAREAVIRRLASKATRTLPLRRESRFDDKTLARILSVTGGVTSGIFSVMSQLAIAAIDSGAERNGSCLAMCRRAASCRRFWGSRRDWAGPHAGRLLACD
jgi:hypothetical protein